MNVMEDEDTSSQRRQNLIWGVKELEQGFGGGGGGGYCSTFRKEGTIREYD